MKSLALNFQTPDDHHVSITSRNGTDTFPWGRTGTGQTRRLAWTDRLGQGSFLIAPFPWLTRPLPPPRLIGRGSWGLLGWQILVSRQRQPVARRDPHCGLVPRSRFRCEQLPRRWLAHPDGTLPRHTISSLDDVVGRGVVAPCGGGWAREIGIRWASAILSSHVVPWPHRGTVLYPHGWIPRQREMGIFAKSEVV